MAKSNLTITLEDKEKEQLDLLVEHFQKQSIANVNKSDVMKFIIDKSYQMLIETNVEAIFETYNKFNIDPDFIELTKMVCRLNGISFDKLHDFIKELKDKGETLN